MSSTTCSRCGTTLGQYEFNHTEEGVICDRCKKEITPKPNMHPAVTFSFNTIKIGLIIFLLLLPFAIVVLLRLIWYVSSVF